MISLVFLFLFAFLAGVATVLSPCILPVLPAILSAGITRGRLRPWGITAGLVVSFTFFTLALTAIVRATGLSPNALRYTAIATIFFFGVVMIFPQLSNLFARLTTPAADVGRRIQYKDEGFVGGFVFGIALGLLWTPCAGPILATITTVVATQSVTPVIVLLTLTYSVGAAIPMFLIAYGGGRVLNASRFLSKRAEGVRQLFGGLMVLSAVAIALHWDTQLQQKIIEAFPPMVIEDTPFVQGQLQQLGNPTPTEAPSAKAPDLVGIAHWINTPPLSLEQLRGKVVLIDFWTYTCINCLRTLPHLTKWDHDYRKDGLVVIGVHTPEFEFEKDRTNVEEAVKRLGIKYPVAMDNGYGTWRAYNNHYWPAHYLVDQQGVVRMVHFGEGAYVETENGIRQLLGLAPLSKEESKRTYRQQSPETYLGYLRGISYTPENKIQPDVTAPYSYKAPLQEDQVGLRGQWKVEEEKITAEGNDSYLDYNFLATQVYLVLSGSSTSPFEVFVDGKLTEKIPMDGNRKYDIATTPYGRHQLSIKIPEGVSAYAFTFGTE